MGVDWEDVLMGRSGSRRLHPKELMESRNEAEAMTAVLEEQRPGNRWMASRAAEAGAWRAVLLDRRRSYRW